MAARLAVRFVLLFIPIVVSGFVPLKAQSAAPGTTRDNLASAYLRMDRAYAIADSMGRISDSTRMQVNRTFDRATLSFFGGRFAAAVAAIDSSVQRLAACAVVHSHRR